MRERTTKELNEPDETLIESTRRGDRRAFAELWRRHYRSGLTVARAFTNLDADDLVSESFARIYQRTLDGGGPRGAFRPYLYTTIRNLACTWGTQRAKHVNVDEIDDFEPSESAEEPVARSLDRTLTVQAYRSLPARWQTVLWYTEVEGLDPSEVAPILGMSANGVAALSYRAREGLRKAWLQAHVSDATASGTCAWVIDRVGEHARRALTDREEQKLQSHLAVCPKCSIVSEEVDDIGARLAMVMLPVLLGGVAAGTLVAASASTGSAAVAAAAIPALPATIGAGAATATATTGILAVAASGVLVAAVGVGGVALVQSNQPEAAAVDKTSSSQQGSLADPLGVDETQAPTAVPVDPSAIPTDAAPAPSATPVVPQSTPAPSVSPDTSTTDDTSEPKPKATADAQADDTTVAAPKPTTTPTAKPTSPTLTGTVTDTTDAVGNVVGTTTDTVDDLVDGTTDVVDGVVDGLLPPGTGLTGTVNSTVDGLTGTVDGLTGGVTGTVKGTVNGVTGTVNGLVGGLLGGK